MNWYGRRVLVTGAGGFIGSHLTERLVTLGAKVRACVRYNSRNDIGLLALLPASIREQIEISFGDLRDGEAIERAMRGVECAFHLGSLISIPHSYLYPDEVIETNVLGTLNVLLAARRCNVRKIIHTSTSEVYGTAHYVPIDEKHPLQGQSPYSASKIGADKIAESFYRSYELPVTIIRPFNTYGPRQSTRAVIPTIICQALSQNEVFLGALDPKRDFTYVDDTVEGFLRIAEASDTVGQEFNLGTGEEITIGDLAEKIVSLIGREVTIRTDPDRLRPDKSEVRRLLADNRRARDFLGWIPKVSLDEGLQRTIEWFRLHITRYQVRQYQV